jgi:hypothetical protein
MNDTIGSAWECAGGETTYEREEQRALEGRVEAINGVSQTDPHGFQAFRDLAALFHEVACRPDK